MAQRILKPNPKLLATIPKEHHPKNECKGCPFGGPRVGSKGNPKAPLVIVAESPGGDEVRAAIPLIGSSGRAFHHFIPDDDNIYVLNALECNPPRTRKTEDRMTEATACCRKRLLDKIKAYPRRLIVTMGNPATRSVLGDDSLKITKIRGRLQPSNLSDLGVLPMVHIAALMRGTGSFRQWREDIEYAKELGAGGSPKIYEEPLLVDVRTIVKATQGSVDMIMESLLWDNNKLTCDIETTGFNPRACRILSVGITPDDNPTVSYCFWPEHIEFLKPYLENPRIEWCWHNGKFDVSFFQELGIAARVDDDTMLMSYVLDEMGGVHDLEQVAADVLDAPDYKFMIDPYLPNKKTSYEVIPDDVLADYQKFDTVNTSQIRTRYRERIRSDRALELLYTKTLLPASPFLLQIQQNGIQVDPERFDENDKYFGDMLESLEAKINDEVGHSINPGSPQQVAKYLFKELKIPDYSKGATDKDAIAKLQLKHPMPFLDMLVEHRGAVKMHGTYVKGYRAQVEDDGRIHANFLLHGTKTGRLACRNPNIQNPPRLKRIRGTFVAREGYELIEVDLSQAELRSLAALSGDPKMVQIYLDDKDLHGDLALQLFPGWDTLASDDPVRKEQRVSCKNVNFGIIYGITEFGLVDSMPGYNIRECATFLNGWYERYNIAAEFIAKCRKAPSQGQDITTMFGRRKRHGLVAKGNINFLRNEAANFPHQSIASDITLHTGMRVSKQLLKWDVRIVNEIHDALLMESPITNNNTTRHKVIEYVSKEFEQVPIDWGITRVPFKADAEVGDRWGSLVNYKELDA